MYAKDKGGSFELAPAGNHLARCVKLVDLGTTESTYQGVTHHRHQCLVMWELPDELMKPNEAGDELPFIVSKFYTLSLHEKAKLRHDLISWRGRDFTPEELKRFPMKNILGAACLVSVVHEKKTNGDMKAVVTAVAKVPKKTVVPDQVNPAVYFSMEPDEFDRDVFDSLSEGLQNLIAESDEWKGFSKPVVLAEKSKRLQTLTDEEELIAMEGDGGVPF